MKEIERLNIQPVSHCDDELENIAAGTDTESLRTSEKTVPLPEARYKKKLTVEMQETLSLVK